MDRLEDRLQEELQNLKDTGMLRWVTDLYFEDSVWARDKEGKRYYVLSTNNYLGFTHHPKVLEVAERTVAAGTGSTGSRLTTGGTFAASVLEEKLAAFKHTEAALIFNTGYMTNLGVLYAICRKGEYIFSDSLNHASIIDGCKMSGAKVLIYPHKDMEALEELLKSVPPGAMKYIVTDGVFSMDGDICNGPELVRLKERYNAILIIDDAHAVGVLGKTGRGTAEYFGLEGKIDIQIGTLSKALGAEGGYVAAGRVVIEYLKNKSRPFIFSTAQPASTLAAANAALDLLSTEGETYLDKLRSNAVFTRNYLKRAGLPVSEGDTPIIPLVVGEADKTVQIFEKLKGQGVLLSAIRPPTVATQSSRLRLTVTAAMEQEDLKLALDKVVACYKEVICGKK